MITQENIDYLCCDALNTFLFQNVWNESVNEFRINIKPMLISKHSFVGSFSVYDGNIALPTVGAYYIWAIAAEHYNVATNLPTCKWIDTATVCNDWRTIINMYGPNGEMFCKTCVYFYYNSIRQTIYIAVKKQMLQKVMKYSDIDRVYLTIYYDSDVSNAINILSIDTSQTRRNTNVFYLIDEFVKDNTNRDQLTYFWNGYEFDPMQDWPPIAKGDYIDVIWDRNIIFSFDVDIHTDNEFPVYLSKLDQTWKQLIHIPKNLNPNNKILTHNTCDFYIRKLYGDDKPKLGYYVHRAAGRRSVSQVTHNDFGVSLFVIDDYRRALDDENVYMHIDIRQHEKDNVLIRDKNYIDLLYKHDDETIVKILMGKYQPVLDKDIDFWTASHLESSKYVEMMFDSPNYATIDNFPDYVHALGYYHVINLLCRRIVDTKITAGFTGILTFNTPLIYSGQKIIPLVYLNKKVINMAYVSCKNNGDDTWTIEISKQVNTKVGDELVVIFFITGNTDIFRFFPSATEQTVTIDKDMEPAIYVKVPAKAGETYKGVGVEVSWTWKRLKEGTNDYVIQEVGNHKKVSFHTKYIGEELLFMNTFCCYRQSYDLEGYTSTGKSIAFKIVTQDTRNKEDVPILNFENQHVYINGTYLVKDIDYFINSVKDEEGNVAFHELVIQTMDHFIPGQTDKLDLMYTVTNVEDISSGFVIEDSMRDETPVNLYFENISMCHVDGRLEREIDYQGIWADLPKGRYQTGDIWEIQTGIPKVVKEYINRFTTNDDMDRIKRLNDYFYDLFLINPPLIILEEKHRIYSTFINNFMYDLSQGKLPLVDEPDIYRMQAQISPYLYLQKMDLCYTKIDQRFVDFYPQFVNYEATPELKRLADKLLITYMPKSDDPTLEVVEVPNG